MALEHERLLTLIEFAQASAKLRGSPVCDAAGHLFHEYEHSLQGLPGLHFNEGGDDDEIWLVVERLYVRDSSVHAAPYLPAQFDDIIPFLKPEEFHAPSENMRLNELVSRIIINEGPIPIELLAERVARAYAFKRTGNKIVERVRKIAAKQFPSHKEKGQEFFWPSGKLINSYQSSRTSAADSEFIRKIEYICSQELCALAHFVEATDHPVDEEQQIRLMAERLGYRRITENIASQLRKAIEKSPSDKQLLI